MESVRKPVSFRISLADIGSDPDALHTLGPGARRVAGYLVAVAEAAASDPTVTVDRLSEQQVAAACRLPLNAVRRVHDELTSMLVSA